MKHDMGDSYGSRKSWRAAGPDSTRPNPQFNGNLELPRPTDRTAPHRIAPLPAPARTAAHMASSWPCFSTDVHGNLMLAYHFLCCDGCRSRARKFPLILVRGTTEDLLDKIGIIRRFVEMRGTHLLISWSSTMQFPTNL